MKSFIDKFIEKLDGQAARGVAPRISVDPLGGFDVFMEKYRVLMMNCFLNGLLNQGKVPKEPFNVALIVTLEKEIVIQIQPDTLSDGLNEARMEFEKHEYFEKAAIYLDYLNLLTKIKPE
jgi:hypothetical protein